MTIQELDKFSTTVNIHAEPAAVWSALTDPGLMTEWMGEPEMKIEIDTSWKVNTPIYIRGFHHVEFENKGVVLKHEKEKKLSYSHLSSISRLPDQPRNYAILEFILEPVGGLTVLTLEIENIPTASIRKHLEFYWRTTIMTIKNVVERQTSESNHMTKKFAI